MENFDKKIKDKVLSFEYKKAPSESEMSKIFEQLEGSQNQDSPFVSVHKKDNVRKIRPIFLRYAAAVALLFVVGLGSYYLNGVDVYVSNGNSITHQLPDGSTVELNADSRISYNKITWLVSRKVSFKGEAFFKVEQESTFSVISNIGSTQVLGTSFNVYSREQDYRVECISGRVKVSYRGVDNKTILTPGKGVKYYDTKEARIFTFKKDTRIDWRNGEFYFDNESIKNIFDEFSRQYDIEVKLSDRFGEIKYSGYFNNKDLETALKMICDPLELNYKINNDNIEIN